MEFRIADTFTDSLARLTSDEQRAVKTAAFDLQLNPAHPSLQFHKLDKAKDRRFWSIRVSSDIRMIVHRTENSLLLSYVGHHDDAYQWGERRKVETHPKTGAAQFVEVRETVQEISIARYVEVPQAAPPKPRLFVHLPEDKLLSYGVPAEWLADVRNANEDTVLDLAGHLPAEAAEALLNLATGVTPEITKPLPAGADRFAHPDAQRRFRVMAGVEELERALNYPWEKWAIFLHPAQRTLVERSYSGPARVAGSAGTGKTIVDLGCLAAFTATGAGLGLSVLDRIPVANKA
jgi:mRNA-degrading endonuclease RelE of RelBE toxin-antitoxin system